MADETKAPVSRGLRPGQQFNPFGLFNGIFIPEALAKSRMVSPGAKLTWGRLARFAGQDGRCYPAVETLGSEIGVGERQTQKYLAELERLKLIRRIRRFIDGAQTSNEVEFLWHSIFEDGAKDRSGEGVNDRSSPWVNDRSPKESQLEESHSEESPNTDPDYPRTNRKSVDSPPDLTPRVNCRRYPRLYEALADYMATEEDMERIYPSDRLVLDVMNVAGGASEEEVLSCLRYLLFERGLRPGSKNGPRHFSWFKTVVADYFHQKHDRDWVVNPGARGAWEHGSRAGLPPGES